MHGRGDGADAADVRQRHEVTEEFLARMHDALRVCAQVGQRLGVGGEMAEGAGDGVDDRVAAAGEGEVGEAHHLFAGERTALEAGLRERAEEAAAGRPADRVELAREVVLQLHAFLQAAADAEDVDAPADPGVGLALVGVEQVGEGAGLDGQGEAVHDLGRLAREGCAQELIDERFDLGDHLRELRTLEEGLRDRAVFSVCGRVRLDGQLAHRAGFFLRGDRHAEGGVRTVGLPILRGLPDLGVPQDHRDLLALEFVAGDGRGFTLLLEGVGRLVAEGTFSTEHGLISFWTYFCRRRRERGARGRAQPKPARARRVP